MDFTADKLATFRQLQSEMAPVSPKELAIKLGPRFSQRSVRRWLAEMVQAGLIEKIGRGRATRYRVLVSSKPVEPTSRFSPESLAVIALVKRPLFERLPVAYADEWFDDYTPNETFYIPAATRAQLYKEGKRSSSEEPAGTYAHRIFNRLLIDLSYNSSRLEGNTYSLLDTERLLLEGKGAVGKLDDEAVMILNHKEAIRYLVDRAPYLTVSTETFCTLHYLLADGLVDSMDAGKVRISGVRIGGSTYMPYENPKMLKYQLDRIAEKAALIEDPYEQSCFLLIHISYLQAFIDVNKRTARLCSNIPLVKHNLVPLSFNDVEKEDYTAALLAIYELQDVRPLVDLYVFSYLRTAAMYDSTVKVLGFDEVRIRYRTQRRVILREIIVREYRGAALQTYVSEQASQIPEKDRAAFIEDIDEDVKYMDLSRIAGLGVTPEELKKWQGH